MQVLSRKETARDACHHIKSRIGYLSGGNRRGERQSNLDTGRDLCSSTLFFTALQLVNKYCYQNIFSVKVYIHEKLYGFTVELVSTAVVVAEW